MIATSSTGPASLNWLEMMHFVAAPVLVVLCHHTIEFSPCC